MAQAPVGTTEKPLETVTTADQAVDQKIADLKLDETYEKVGVAKGY